MTTTKPARKTPAKKAVKVPSLSVPFRGELFVISGETRASTGIQMRAAAFDHFRDSRSATNLLFELLGPVDSARWIALCGEPGDDVASVSTEFLTALRAEAEK